MVWGINLSLNNCIPADNIMNSNPLNNLITGLIILSSMLVNSANANEQLTATIIGSGSPIHNEDRASASVLVSAGNTSSNQVSTSPKNSGTYQIVDTGQKKFYSDDKVIS
jgi:hypothetical protein